MNNAIDVVYAFVSASVVGTYAVVSAATTAVVLIVTSGPRYVIGNLGAKDRNACSLVHDETYWREKWSSENSRGHIS